MLSTDLSMSDEAENNALVSDRVDRALSVVAVFVTSVFLAGALSMGRFAHASCPASEACAPALLGTILCSLLAVLMGGVLYLFQPRD